VENPLETRTIRATVEGRKFWPHLLPTDISRHHQRMLCVTYAPFRLRDPAPSSVRPRGHLLFPDAARRALARRWHIENPEFLMGVLVETGTIPDDNPHTRARVLPSLHEAVAIGLYSKADLCQYCIACLNAGGSILSVPTVRAFFDQFTEDTPDIMARLIAAAPVHFWTYLPQKVQR
jgi:hypothetical protein